MIRQVEAEVGRPIGILADLQGPKLRVGIFADRPGDAGRGRALPHRPRSRPTATSTRVCLPHPEIFAALEPGSTLLVNDGKIRLQGHRVLAASIAD